LELHETVAVPEVEMLAGLMDPQVKPEGRVPSVRVIVPVNPFRAAVVIVELVDWPALTGAGTEFVTVKSACFTVNVPIEEWTRVPLVPINVREYVPPALALQDTVAVPEAVKLLGLIVPQVSPDGTLSVRVTVPTNPFSAFIVIVELADWPVLTALGEVAEIVKSGAGGPRLRNLSRQPQPIGELAHCIAP
jgi:hypothetical protein